MMKPTVEQIVGDRYYLETYRAAKSFPVGTVVSIVHDNRDIGKVLPSDRLYRIWRKTEDGWKFERVQKGRFRKGAIGQ